MRVSELDSVRGLAAFVVLLHHLWQTILPDQNTFPLPGYPGVEPGALGTAAFWISVTPLRLLFCGHSAVGVFFVLSGFALSKALQSPSNSSYWTFLVRRFFRIYPPFALVILVAAALSWGIHPEAVAGREWINHYWRAEVTPAMVAGHLAMIDTAGYFNSLNSCMWTLVHELRISIVFPFIAAVTLVYPRGVLVASLAAFTLLSITHLTGSLGALIQRDLAREVFFSALQTLRYVLFFVLGTLVANKSALFESWLSRHPQSVKYLWVVTALLLAVPYSKGYTELLYAIGAFLLLVLCLHSQTARAFLRNPVLQWLGKVSYSLYLIHMVVLLAAVYLLYERLPIAVILLLVVGVSLLSAQLLNRAVELPSNEIGKWLTRRPAPRSTPVISHN